MAALFSGFCDAQACRASKLPGCLGSGPTFRFCNLGRVSLARARRTRPTAGARRIFVANNDFYWTGYQGTPCCWAEQSLKMAELILKTHFGLAKPDWLNATYYDEKISKM